MARLGQLSAPRLAGSAHFYCPQEAYLAPLFGWVVGVDSGVDLARWRAQALAAWKCWASIFGFIPKFISSG
jgi:hypothetical protein